jgi:protein-S-isoprenylcysteine O-methyltransferase Ste14
MSSHRYVTIGWAAMASTMALIVAHLVLGRGPHAPLRAVGAGFLLLSGLLFIPPFFVLARYGKPPADRSYMDTSLVVSHGPYGIVRHPQYLGYVCLSIGFTLQSQAWPAAVLGALSVALFYALAVAEERQLVARFGDGYIEYCRRVPRFNLLAGLLRRTTRSRE